MLLRVVVVTIVCEFTWVVVLFKALLGAIEPNRLDLTSEGIALPLPWFTPKVGYSTTLIDLTSLEIGGVFLRS